MANQLQKTTCLIILQYQVFLQRLHDTTAVNRKLRTGGNPAESMFDCFHLYWQPGGSDRIGCTVFMDGSRTLLDCEAPPWMAFGDWAISIYYEVLRFAVFLNEMLDLWLWPFSTVISRVFWQECLIETPESVWVPFPLLGLLELCQLAYTCSIVLCLTHPRLAPSHSASLCVFRGFMEWFSTALKCSIL